MKTRTLFSLAIAATMLGGSAVGVVAQDAESEVRSRVYATGTAGNPPRATDPSQRRAPDGQLQIRGLQLLDIPVSFSDSRLSGLLTISSNGAARDFADGHARLEPRTYRIDNDDGSWTGSGERVLALSVAERKPLINHESMVLFGEGDYEGLVAYVFIELANATPELQAVVLDIDLPPLPEPIAARDGADFSGPRGPGADATARQPSGDS